MNCLRVPPGDTRRPRCDSGAISASSSIPTGGKARMSGIRSTLIGLCGSMIAGADAKLKLVLKRAESAVVGAAYCMES